MDTKAILKYLKLNESTISMVLGALVIVILGFIVINYFRNSTIGQVTPATNTEAQVTPQPTVKRGEGPVEYIVAKGESLWSIAEKQYGSGYNWVDIARASKISNANRIGIGQKITIPDTEPKTLTVKTANVSERSTEQITSSTYIVSKGDTLWSVSVRAYANGSLWTKIAAANKLVHPDIIHSGNTLTIPR